MEWDIWDFETVYNWFILPAIWVIILFVWLVRREKEKREEQERIRERDERAARHDREWNEQLRRSPWLRDVIATHHRLEEQIHLQLQRNGNGEIVIIDAMVMDGEDVIVLDELIIGSSYPYERVNWKKEGF